MAIAYNSNFDETVPFSDVCAQVHLAANTVESFTVPGGVNQRYSVRFGYPTNTNIYVGLNTVPTVPAVGTVDIQQYVEFKPGFDGSQRYANGGDVLHFISNANVFCGVSLRQLP